MLPDNFPPNFQRFQTFTQILLSWQMLKLFLQGNMPHCTGFALPVPEGSLKYPATASFTGWLVLSSHNTMKSAIIAVTKSA